MESTTSPRTTAAPSIKAMRAAIAQAVTVTCIAHTKHPANVGTTYPVTKHQKNALRIECDGKPFWVSLDVIRPVDGVTFVTIGSKNSPYPGQDLGTYRLSMAASASA